MSLRSHSNRAVSVAVGIVVGVVVGLAGLLLPLTAVALPAAAANRVSRVVVYPDRAQVSRLSTVPCGERTMVRFASLPPAAVASSLRAQTSIGRIEGVRSEEHALGESFAKKLEALDEQTHQVELELGALREQQSRDDSATQLAGRYEGLAQTLIGRELGEQANPRLWSAALDSALQIRLQGAAGRSERARKQRELERKLGELSQQRQRQQAAAARRDLSAEVLLSCPSGQVATVELTYLVGGAGWQPSHEARLADSASQPALTLTSFATVTQSSGEDWLGAQLTLSTAVPRQNATPPSISALRVYADPREPPKKVLVSRSEQHEHAEAPAGAATTPTVSGKLPQRSDQGLSVQFQARSPADIPGDGTPSRLVIAETQLPARLSFRTVPKLLPYVFRVADLTNSSGYPLLSGPLDAFRKGQFLAHYEVAHVASGAHFQLTFGLEDRLKVRRHVVEELARDQGLFGGTHRHRYVYRFELANYLDHPDQLELAEHIPVSELDDIKVQLSPQTTSGYKLNADDGIVTWQLALAPGEKRIVSLSYFVDVPTSYSE